MHPNPAFRKEGRARNIAYARDRAFGTLAVNADPAPLVSHIPFQLAEDGISLEAHLVRSNPIARLLKEPQPVVISIVGPDAYISPDWYGIEDQVPTWNYVAVHLRGVMQLEPHEALEGVLQRLSDDMEKRLLPKPIWTMDKMTPDSLTRMMRQILPVSMKVDQIDGTWKLNQNKDPEVIARAKAALSDTKEMSERQKLVALMGKTT